jgi:hypothetical protein
MATPNPHPPTPVLMQFDSTSYAKLAAQIGEIDSSKASAEHTHAVDDVTNLSTTLESIQSTSIEALTTEQIAAIDLTTDRTIFYLDLSTLKVYKGEIASGAMTATEIGSLTAPAGT